MLKNISNNILISTIASKSSFEHRNLMKDSTEEILKTFFDHEFMLKQLYNEQVTQFVSVYEMVFFA